MSYGTLVCDSAGTPISSQFNSSNGFIDSLTISNGDNLTKSYPNLANKSIGIIQVIPGSYTWAIGYIMEGIPTITFTQTPTSRHVLPITILVFII